jgi:PPOX class probable F420-dependent enzyme
VNQPSSEEKAGDPFIPLYSFQFIQLKTFRKNGTPVPTVVWFAPENGKLYVRTAGNASKVKRIRNNHKVLMTPSDQRGKILGDGIEIEGQARELPQEEHQYANAVLLKKYGFTYRIFTFFLSLRRTERTFIEICPA